ncbi:MAG: hypothetical protein ABJA79_02795 [Parafilimonas sp.]
MIKKWPFPFFIFLVLICNSACKKNPAAEPLPPPPPPPPAYNNPFGILVSASNGTDTLKQHLLTPKDAASLARDLGVAYARVAVSNTTWGETDTRQSFLDEYNAYTKGSPSIKVLLNVNWGKHATGAQAYPGATPDYKAFIKDLLDTLTSPGYVPPAVIVVENEENNKQFHVLETQADQDNYIAMLKFDIEECHKRNLKVTNGGLTNMGVVLVVRDYFLNVLHDTARATAFADSTFPPKMQRDVDNDFYTSKLVISRYFMNAYAPLNLDYINIHWYEPIKLAFWYDADRAKYVDTAHITPGSLAEVLAFFRDPVTEGGKQLMANEVGQVTPANELPMELTCALQGLPYVIWYSGDRNVNQSIRPYLQYALHNTYTTGQFSFTIRSTGDIFRDNIANIIANPFTFCPPM